MRQSVAGSGIQRHTGTAECPVAQVQHPPPRPVAPPAQSSAPPHAVSAGDSAGIPTSLRSQMASMTPEAGGAKPAEAAMSSIEPVNLPESAVWGLLAQPVDPVYPDAAKASGQKGSVVLQVVHRAGRRGAGCKVPAARTVPLPYH